MNNNTMKSKTVALYQLDNFTFKVQEGTLETFDHGSLMRFIGFVFECWKVPAHLFITGVLCEGFRMSPDPQDVAWGMYREGVQDIMLALDQENVEEVYVTAAHEIYHYVQDLQGMLGDSENSEEAADKKSVEVYESYKASAISQPSTVVPKT